MIVSEFAVVNLNLGMLVNGAAVDVLCSCAFEKLRTIPHPGPPVFVASAVLPNYPMPLCHFGCYLMQRGRLWVYVKYLVILQSIKLRIKC